MKTRTALITAICVFILAQSSFAQSAQLVASANGFREFLSSQPTNATRSLSVFGLAEVTTNAESTLLQAPGFLVSVADPKGTMALLSAIPQSPYDVQTWFVSGGSLQLTVAQLPHEHMSAPQKQEWSPAPHSTDSVRLEKSPIRFNRPGEETIAALLRALENQGLKLDRSK